MEIRGTHCSKKLAVGKFEWLEIKCNRCKTVNSLRTMRSPPEHHECHHQDTYGQHTQVRKPLAS